MSYYTEVIFIAGIGHKVDLIALGSRLLAARKKRAVKEKRSVPRARVVSELDNIRGTEEMISERTLARWEAGESQPKPANLHDLARVLKVPHEEEIYWLGLAGYLFPTRMPTKEQIITVLEVYYQDIYKYSYPAIITDYDNHLWAVNPAVIGLVGSYKDTVNLIKSFTSFHQIMFDTELGFTGKVPDLDGVQRRQIYALLLNNLHRRHEPLWQSYPKRMKEKFRNTADYLNFEAKWQEICNDELNSDDFSKDIMQGVVNSSYLRYLANGTEIRFKVLSDTPGYFYGNVFQVVRYVPNGDEDRIKADEYFRPFTEMHSKELKVWNVRDVDELLEDFE